MDGNQLMLLGVAIMVVPFAFLLFLAIGPLGWILVGGVVFLVGLAAKRRKEPESGRAATGVNCPDCGARNDEETEECHYCGAALNNAGEA